MRYVAPRLARRRKQKRRRSKPTALGTSQKWLLLRSLFLGLLRLREELLADVARNFGVLRELHRELGLALRRATERRREAEHFRQRNLGVDARVAVFFGRTHDDAAALHDETEHVARELRRTFERDLHD